jgi:hypothetical protein
VTIYLNPSLEPFSLICASSSFSCIGICIFLMVYSDLVIVILQYVSGVWSSLCSVHHLFIVITNFHYSFISYLRLYDHCYSGTSPSCSAFYGFFAIIACCQLPGLCCTHTVYPLHLLLSLQPPLRVTPLS